MPRQNLREEYDEVKRSLAFGGGEGVQRPVPTLHQAVPPASTLPPRCLESGAPSAFSAVVSHGNVDREQLQRQIEEMDRQRQAAELKLQQLSQMQHEQQQQVSYFITHSEKRALNDSARR